MRPCRFALAVVALGVGCGAAAAGPPPTSLLAVSPSRPGVLQELERLHAPLVSYDPGTGVAWVVGGADLERRLADAGLVVATADPDLDAALARLQGPRDLGPYHTWDETVAELESLHAAFPLLTALEDLGPSLEGRPILALKIADEPARDDPGEADVLVVGCHHAREFMSVEVPLHLARTLLAGYATSPQARRLVDERELWIVPMLNPDGHVHQEELQTNPSWLPPGWRKNRRPNLDETFGVDPNRNYAHEWGHDDIGSSSEGGAETYRGTAPFSEPETRALARLVERQRFTIALSFHSFGRLVLYPWGWTRSQLTEDQEVFATLADSMVRGNGYTPGNPHFGTIYLTNGDFDDWMYGELTPSKPTRTLAFTVELNSQAQGGFWPDPRLIEPTCDTMLPLQLFALEVAANVRAPLRPPAPVLAATQDAGDRRRIHLTWTQPHDPTNPVDHWEVFEIDPGGPVPAAEPVAIDAAGRGLVARDLPRPGAGSVGLALDAELEPLWDYAYVEARGADGVWRPLPGDATSELSPTGRNAGNGLTGNRAGSVLRFRLDPVPGPQFDLAVRLDPMPGAPQHARLRAALDWAATYLEERRVIAPWVREPRYEVVAERPGIFAYGVTAVDAQGQRADSEVFFFAIPTLDVVVQDVELVADGARVELRWTSLGAARFEAWSRRQRASEPLEDAAGAWADGDWQRVGERSVAGARRATVAWTAEPGRHLVLLRGLDADGERLFGPWSVAVTPALRLAPPVPNPFNPTTVIEFEIASAGPMRLEVLGVDGRVVRTLAAGAVAPGIHRVVWDGRDAEGTAVASGVWVLRLQASGTSRVQRLVLLR